MKGIHIHVRGGTPYNACAERSLIQFDIAGADVKKTIEACAARLPESLRASLRKQLGRAIEHGNEELHAQCQASDGAVCLATLRPCEVIS